MTASAPIGTLRGVPDSASLSLDSGASVKGTSKDTSPKSTFHSVLEQYRASRENPSESDEAKGKTQQKQKDSNSGTTPAVPQPTTPATDSPRLILPFTTSITLRQDSSSPQDDTASQDATASADDAAANASTAAADSNALPSVIANTSITSAILRSTLDLNGLPSTSDTNTNDATAAAPSKTQSKSRTKPKNPAPSQIAAATLDQATQQAQTAPADPSIPIRVTESTTLEQAATVVQNSSTVSDAPYTVATSTSDRAMAYQYQSSDQRPAKTATGNRTSQGPQKASDPTPAVAASVTLPTPVANPVTNTGEPQSSLHPAGGSNTPRPGGSAASQDSSVAAGSDSKTALPSGAEPIDNTTAPANSGMLAFAARLTPTTESQPPVASDSTRPAEPMPSSQATLQSATPITAKQVATGADLPADAHSGEGGGPSDKEKPGDLFAKPETLLPQMHVAVPDQTAAPASNHVSASPLSPAAQMDKVIDPPTAAPKANNDITVRIPDSTDQGTAVRFVERAGEIHVSVRTGDVEIAQSLRGGLNDLVNHLEDGGIRTEVWQPGTGSNGSSSQNDSHQPFADPDGSNGRQYSSGSNSEQESKQQNKPRWVEELEGSIGNQNSKETPQLLWQA